MLAEAWAPERKTDPERGAGALRGEEGSPARRSPGHRDHRSLPAPPGRSGLAHARALPQPLHAAPAAARASGGGESGTGKEVAGARGESLGNRAEPEGRRGAASRGGRHRAQRAGPAPAAVGREACPTTLLSNGKGRGKRVISAPSAARCPARVLTAAASRLLTAVRVDLVVAVADVMGKAALIILYPNSSNDNKYGGGCVCDYFYQQS